MRPARQRAARWSAWTSGWRREGNPGGIRFLFDCGSLPDSALTGIVLQAEEISDSRWYRCARLSQLLRKPIRRRVRAVRTRSGAPRNHPLVYLENGRPAARSLIARQANALITGASRATSSGPARSGSAMKTVLTPRSASRR